MNADESMAGADRAGKGERGREENLGSPPLLGFGRISKKQKFSKNST